MTHHFWNTPGRLIVKKYCSENSDIGNEIKRCPYQESADWATFYRLCVLFDQEATCTMWHSAAQTIRTVHESVIVSRVGFTSEIWDPNFGFHGYPVRIWLRRSSSMFEVTETYFNDEWQSIKKPTHSEWQRLHFWSTKWCPHVSTISTSGPIRRPCSYPGINGP